MNYSILNVTLNVTLKSFYENDLIDASASVDAVVSTPGHSVSDGGNASFILAYR